MRCLYEAGFFLNESEVATVQALGSLYVRTFLQLARAAVDRHVFCGECALSCTFSFTLLNASGQ